MKTKISGDQVENSRMSILNEGMEVELMTEKRKRGIIRLAFTQRSNKKNNNKKLQKVLTMITKPSLRPFHKQKRDENSKERGKNPRVRFMEVLDFVQNDDVELHSMMTEKDEIDSQPMDDDTESISTMHISVGSIPYQHQSFSTDCTGTTIEGSFEKTLSMDPTTSFQSIFSELSTVTTRSGTESRTTLSHNLRPDQSSVNPSSVVPLPDFLDDTTVASVDDAIKTIQTEAERRGLTPRELLYKIDELAEKLDDDTVDFKCFPAV